MAKTGIVRKCPSTRAIGRRRRNLSSWRKNYVMDQGRRAVILGAVLCKYYKGRPNAQTYCIYNGWEPSLCQEMPSGAAGGPLTGLQQTG